MIMYNYVNKNYERVEHMWEVATGGALWKKVFLKILQNSQENNCVGISF